MGTIVLTVLATLFLTVAGYLGYKYYIMEKAFLELTGLVSLLSEQNKQIMTMLSLVFGVSFKGAEEKVTTTKENKNNKTNNINKEKEKEDEEDEFSDAPPKSTDTIN